MSVEVEHTKFTVTEVSQPFKKASKIPIRSKNAPPQVVKKEKGQEKQRKRTQSAEKASAPATHHMETKIRSRHASGREQAELSSSIGSKESKENLAPKLSSSCSSITLPNKTNPKRCSKFLWTFDLGL